MRSSKSTRRRRPLSRPTSTPPSGVCPPGTAPAREVSICNLYRNRGRYRGGRDCPQGGLHFSDAGHTGEASGPLPGHAARVELFSRNRLSFNARFPEVVTALANLPSTRFVVDGEVVAFDGDQTSFALLQSSPHPKGLTYSLFDLLSLDGRDTTGLALPER